YRLIHFTFVFNVGSQIEMSSRVVGRNLQRMLPERSAAAPILKLCTCHPHTYDHDQSASCHQCRCSVSVRLQYLNSTEREHYEYPDQGHIGVAVCHRLPADLNQSDNGHKSAQVPEPSNCNVWSPPRHPACKNRQEDYTRNRCEPSLRCG